MERKEFEESHNQTDVRYIRRDPKLTDFQCGGSAWRHY
jgi:hypothetical protein